MNRKEFFKRVKRRMNKKRRGVLPVILLLLIPVGLWLAWQLAEILVDATKERI